MKNYTIHFFILLIILFIQFQYEIYAQDYNLLKTYSEYKFIENQGQWPSEVKFFSKYNGLNLWITKNEIYFDYLLLKRNGSQDWNAFDKASEDHLATLNIKGHIVKMNFVPSENNILKKHSFSKSIKGKSKMNEYRNYFLGSNPTLWAVNVPVYREIQVEELYPGIGVRYYFDHGKFRYDLIIQPGADINDIKIKFEGASDITIKSESELCLKTSMGEILHQGLKAYQIIDDVITKVECNFKKLDNESTFGFKAVWKEPNVPLIIDPLVFSTFLGGSDSDIVESITCDKNHNIYVTGQTYSSDFPTSIGAYQDVKNNYDAFFCKLSAAGDALMYASFLGGDKGDYGKGLEIDVNQYIVITGDTYSNNFPTTQYSYDNIFHGNSDGFACKFSNDGSNMVYSTFIGGSSSDHCYDLVINNNNEATIYGTTSSTDFPVTAGAFNTTSGDQFIVTINENGENVLYGTYFNNASINDIYLTKEEHILITGSTKSVNFPTTDIAYNKLHDGESYYAFVTKFNQEGSDIDYSTLIFKGIARAITVDDNSNPVIVGYTDAIDFPTTEGSYDRIHNGGDDIFVTKLNNTGSNLIFSSLIGGSGSEIPSDIELDTNDNIIIGGSTKSNDYPLTIDAIDCDNHAYEVSWGIVNWGDCFLTKLSHDAEIIMYSTYLGDDESDDYITEVVMKPDNNTIIGGNTYSSNFPVTEGSYDVTFNFSYDGFISEVEFPSFTEKNITIKSPNGGESWEIGTIHDITWISHNVENVLIEYSINDGIDWSTISSNMPAASGSFSWTVPNTPSSYCRIRISDVSDTTKYDISDGRFTIPTLYSESRLLWYRSGYIYSSKLGGEDRKEILHVNDRYGSTNEPWDIEVNMDDEKIYWTDWFNGTIVSSNLEGEFIDTLLYVEELGYGSPRSLCYDPKDKKIYIGTTTNIIRTDTNGSDLTCLYSGIGWDIEIDTIRSKIYWLESSKIKRADLDFSEIEEVVSISSMYVGACHSFSLDLLNEKIYWAQCYTTNMHAGGGIIRRISFDGSDLDYLQNFNNEYPYAIEIHPAGNCIYWTDYGNNKVNRSNPDGRQEEELYSTSYGRTMDICLALDFGADFRANQQSGGIPLVVHFSDLSCGTITKRLWEFGDGETSSEINPTHIYTKSGEYTVSLTIEGPKGIHTERKEDFIVSAIKGEVEGYWSKSESPYFIQGVVTVPRSKTLTLGPGTIIYGDDDEYTILNIQGELIANGEKNNPIVFTNTYQNLSKNNITDKGYGRWQGIVVDADRDEGWWGRATLSHCIIKGLTAGITILGGSFQISNCTFQYNQKGISMSSGWLGSPQGKVSSCTIKDNWQWGIEMRSYAGGQSSGINATIDNNIIQGNGNGIRMSGVGGTASSWTSTSSRASTYVTISNNWIANNEGNAFEVFAEGQRTQGHVSTHTARGSVSAKIKNNIVINNGYGIVSETDDDDYYLSECQLTIGNNTFWNNDSLLKNKKNSNLIVYNSILWGDDPVSIQSDEEIPIIITYSDIRGGFAGEGNLDIDPMFIDPINENFYLQEGSPCIDTGDPESELDPDGTRADMGAYYYGANIVGFWDKTPESVCCFELRKNYPNPFNPETIISFSIPHKVFVELSIYNINGQFIQKLISQELLPGPYSISWKPKNLPNGIYFYSIKAGKFRSVKKMIYIK